MLAAAKTTSLFILASLIVLAAAVPHAYALSDVDFKPPELPDIGKWIQDNIIKPIADAFGWFMDQVKNAIGGIFSGIYNAITSFFSGLSETLYSIVRMPVDALRSAWGSIDRFINWLPDYAKPAAPLIVTGVVAAAGLMIWYIVKAVIPGI